MAPLRFESDFPIPTLQRELERFLRNPAISLGLSGRGAYPQINVFDDGAGVVVVAEVPGLDPGQIKIASQGRTISISSERTPQEIEKSAAGYHRRERVFGPFSRSIQLPQDLDPQQATAKYENGLLVIRVPKAESAKLREITVQSA